MRDDRDFPAGLAVLALLMLALTVDWLHTPALPTTQQDPRAYCRYTDPGSPTCEGYDPRAFHCDPQGRLPCDGERK